MLLVENVTVIECFLFVDIAMKNIRSEIGQSDVRDFVYMSHMRQTASKSLDDALLLTPLHHSSESAIQGIPQYLSMSHV